MATVSLKPLIFSTVLNGVAGGLMMTFGGWSGFVSYLIGFVVGATTALLAMMSRWQR